jgi:hypothetical protein
MKATLIYRSKLTLQSGLLIEAVIWNVPVPVPPTTHGYKYRLVAIRDGVRLAGYDNERGKGDHQHVGNKEITYTFTTVEQLLADFLRDVKELENA